MRATKKVLPHVLDAVNYLLYDQGLDDGVKSCELPETFESEHMPAGERIDWQRVERFLAKLSEEDLETFCIGEQDDMVAVAKRGGDEGEYAHRAMDTLFEGIGSLSGPV